MTDESPQLKFYTDKNIAKAVTIQLRKHGVDIIRCEEVGLGDADDITHLEFATHEGRVIITQDADFARYHATWQSEGKNILELCIVYHIYKEMRGLVTL